MNECNATEGMFGPPSLESTAVSIAADVYENDPISRSTYKDAKELMHPCMPNFIMYTEFTHGSTILSKFCSDYGFKEKNLSPYATDHHKEGHGYQVQIYKVAEGWARDRQEENREINYPNYIIAFAGTEPKEESLRRDPNFTYWHEFYSFITNISDSISNYVNFKIADLVTDLVAGLNQKSMQYHRAKELGKQLQGLSDEDILFTGHSLGGGLAACAALWARKRAITFNAMGVPKSYRTNIGLPSRYQTPPPITNYHTYMDLLTNMQETIPTLSEAVRKDNIILEDTSERNQGQNKDLRELFRKTEPIISRLSRELEGVNEKDVWHNTRVIADTLELLKVLLLRDKPEGWFENTLYWLSRPIVGMNLGMNLATSVDPRKLALLNTAFAAHLVGGYMPAFKKWEVRQEGTTK